MKPMRILQFITPAGFYGAERWVLALANNLKPDDIICDLAVTDEGGGQDISLADYYPTSLGQIHRIPLQHRFDIKAVTKLCKIIRERHIDIIHTHGYKSDILGLLAARHCGIKCVTTPHGFSGKVGLKLRFFINVGIFSYRFFDRVVPLSPELLENIYRFGVPNKKIEYIGNGVDLTELYSYKKTRPRTHKMRHIGYVGQLIPRKGIKDLLKLFNRVWEAYPDATLTLVGDGVQRNELETFANTLPSRNNIHFLGFRPDRLTIIRNFDLFVMTSTLEGIPRCIMEAMSVGIPVAAYDIPGVDQLIESNKTGILAPLGDWEGLAKQCLELLHDPKLGQALAENAQTMIEERYSAARMAEEYQVLFEKLLDLFSEHNQTASNKVKSS